MASWYYVRIALALFFLFSGCSYLEDASPAPLLNPNLYKHSIAESYKLAGEAPESEWKIVRIGHWKKRKTRYFDEECRSITRTHDKTGVLEYSSECRSLGLVDRAQEAEKGWEIVSEGEWEPKGKSKKDQNLECHSLVWFHKKTGVWNYGGECRPKQDAAPKT